jgi:hypothetical protein
MHPRTDPVVITAILDETGDKILLGRNVRDLAPNSTLAHSRLPPPNYRRSSLAVRYVIVQ